MSAIGSTTKPVYVGANGDARPCDLELHDISVTNKGDNEVIAIITIDGTEFPIKNIKQGGTAFSVTFKDYDGTVLKTEAVLKGGNATPPTSPTREGYDFKSWNGTYTNVQADQVVIATYQIKTFTVIFRQSKDGVYTTLKTQTGVEWGTAATAPDKPTAEGYTTGDWDKSFSSIKADTTVTCTLTPIALTVTFNDYDGSLIENKSVAYGTLFTDVAKPSDPSRTGYTFTGWSTPTSGLNASGQVIGNCLSTAQYKIKTFTVKFYNYENASSPASTQTVNYGDIPKYTPSLTGWTFDSWSTKSGTSYGSPVTRDSVYSGTWLKEFDNLLCTTHTDAPGESTTVPGAKSVHSLFPLATSSELALPVGARIDVYNTHGLLQHDGGAKTHHLVFAPAYISSGFNGSYSTLTVPTETYTKLYDDRENPEEETETATTVSLSMKNSKTDYSDWGEWAPISNYGDVNETWERPASPAYSVWSPMKRYSALGSTTYIADETMLSTNIDVNKISGTESSVRTFQWDTTCHEGVEVYEIPSALNGHPVTSLGLDLIKITSGCTVAWRLHLYRLILLLS